MELAKPLKIVFHSLLFFLAFFLILPTFQLNEPFGDNHLLVDPDFTDIREALRLVPMGEMVSYLEKQTTNSGAQLFKIRPHGVPPASQHESLCFLNQSNQIFWQRSLGNLNEFKFKGPELFSAFLRLALIISVATLGIPRGDCLNVHFFF